MKKKTRPRYAILGSGGIGLAVAKELENRGKSLVLVDKDKAKVETLKEQNLEAIPGDIGEEEVIDLLQIENLEAAFILSSDFKANKKALSFIRKISQDIPIVSRAFTSDEKEDLEAAGADLVVLPSKLPYKGIATAIVQYIERIASIRLAQELLKVIKTVGDGKLAIVVHDNPDPDAVSSAMALKEIARSIDVKADILYQGKIGHQENKAFINLLDIELNQPKEYNPADYKKVGLIEATVPGAYNLLPPNSKVNIIIDHHQVNHEVVGAEFVDTRPTIGATATIMTKYMHELEIPIKTELATALLYGIRVDTQDFRRNTDPADLMAAAFLYPLANHEILSRIETPSISASSLDVIGEAIKNRQIRGSFLISSAGAIHDRDSLAQAADYLLNLEGITTTLIFGLGEDRIYVSGRTRDIKVNIGRLMQAAFGEEYAGGHATLGGAQIPLGVFSSTKDKQALMRLAEEAVLKRFLAVIGMEEQI